MASPITFAIGDIHGCYKELDSVFQAMLVNAMRLCEASHGVVWLREGEGFRSAALTDPGTRRLCSNGEAVRRCDRGRTLPSCALL